MTTTVMMAMSIVVKKSLTLLPIHLIGLVINYRDQRGHSGNIQYQQEQVGEYQLRFALCCRMLLNAYESNQIKSDDDDEMDLNKTDKTISRLSFKIRDINA